MRLHMQRAIHIQEKGKFCEYPYYYGYQISS